MRTSRGLDVAMVVAAVVVARTGFAMGSVVVAIIGVAVCLAGVVVVRRSRVRSLGTGGLPVRESLVVAWLLLSFVTTHRFTSHPTPDQFLDAEWFFRVVVYAMAGLVSLAIIRSREPTLRSARPPQALLLLPLWATLSFLWSDTPAATAVEGGQLVATGLLAWATIAVGRADPVLFERVVVEVLRWFVRIVLALTVWGLVDRGVDFSFEDAARFTWYGAHPLGSGFLLSAAVVIVAFAPGAILRMPPSVRLAAFLTMSLALVANHSRQMIAAAVVAMLVGLLATGKPLVRRIGFPLLGAVACAGLLYAPDALGRYVLRSGDTGDLAAGNGRLKLWGVGFDSMETSFDWWFGHGKGITHTLFIQHFDWAISAHNSVLAALVGLGVIGVALFTLMVVAVLRATVESRLWRTPLGLTLTILLGPLLGRGAFGDSLMTAAPAFTLFFLVAAASIVTAEQRRAPRASDRATGASTPSETTAGGAAIVTGGRS